MSIVACENETVFGYYIILYCVCCGLLLLVDILYIIIASLTAALQATDKPLENIVLRDDGSTDYTLSDSNKKDGDDYTTDVQPIKIYRVIVNNEQLSYAKAEEFCKLNNKHLPHPQSQYEEDKIIADIGRSEAAKCRFVFFGFVANAKFRYRSLNSEETKPSLKEWRKDETPFQFTECYALRSFPSGKLRVISQQKCDRLTEKNILVLKIFADYCRRHRFRCVEVLETSSGNNISYSFSEALKADPTIVLLPYDKNNHPENLRLQGLTQDGPFVAMATTYDFRYEFGGIRKGYASSRFTIVDPEYDCLAYDTVANKMVTRDCESLACPICY